MRVAPPLRTGERGGLDRRADRHDFVGTGVPEHRAFEKLFDALAHGGNARRSADQQDLIEVAGRESGDAERFAADVESSIDDRGRKPLEIGARVTVFEIERTPTGSVRDLGDVDRRFRVAGKPDFQLFRCGAQALESLAVGARVVFVLRQKFARHVLGDREIDVVAA